MLLVKKKKKKVCKWPCCCVFVGLYKEHILEYLMSSSDAEKLFDLFRKQCKE